MKQKKHHTPEEALAKLQKYCAYQERSHHEVRYKLVDIGIYGDKLEEIMSALISDDYLNEERFARAFARGKFRMKHWGRIKIKMALKQKRVSDYCIRKGLSEINDEEYHQTLQDLISKRLILTKESNTFTKRRKIADFCLRKGYESELVWEALAKMVP